MAKQTKIIRAAEKRHMVITPVFRVSFPNLFKPRSFQDSDASPKSFSVDMIFDSKDVLSEEYKGKKKQTVSLSKAVLNAKIDQWGPKKEKWPAMPYPVFKDGNERTNKDGEVYQGYADKIFATAKCGEKFPPVIIGADGKPLDERALYGGCYARAQVIARPYAFGKNHGVRLLLVQVMKVRDGERFGGMGGGDVFDVEEVDAMDSDEDSNYDSDSIESDDF